MDDCSGVFGCWFHPRQFAKTKVVLHKQSHRPNNYTYQLSAKQLRPTKIQCGAELQVILHSSLEQLCFLFHLRISQLKKKIPHKYN